MEQKECCEAIPGPAIILTKEEAEKVKNSKSKLSKSQKMANEKLLEKIKNQIKSEYQEGLTR